MARQRSDLEIEVDDAMRGWVAINRIENPMEWEAWIKWREENMRSFIRPENLTVPTEFPPLTVAAAKDYLEVVRKTRVMIGWSNGVKLLSKNPSAWMG